MDKPHKCPLCPRMTTTSLCGSCTEDVEQLEIDPPPPLASPEDVQAWIQQHNISSFSYRASMHE